MGNLNQTTSQVQTDLDAVEASNVGLDSVSDLSDTAATAATKSGMYGLGASSSNAPSTDRSVIFTAARDVDASGEIRRGQIVLTESNTLHWNVDDGGSLGTWFEAVKTSGAQNITTTGVVTGATVEATGDTSAGDNSALGYTATEGAILTGQGSTNDVTIKNDADSTVISIPTGTTGVVLAGDLTMAGMFNPGGLADLTIASGAVTATRTYLRIDTESAASSDDLDTINGGSQGDLIIVQAADSSRTVVLKDGTGNLELAGDFSMDNVEDKAFLIYTSAGTWSEISRSGNGA